MHQKASIGRLVRRRLESPGGVISTSPGVVPNREKRLPRLHSNCAIPLSWNMTTAERGGEIEELLDPAFEDHPVDAVPPGRRGGRHDRLPLRGHPRMSRPGDAGWSAGGAMDEILFHLEEPRIKKASTMWIHT